MSNVSNNPIKDIIIPAAGLGSRLFPMTLAVPKNLLSVGEKTLIQYAVEESLLCGAERIHIICSKAHLELYKNQFKATDEIRELLDKKGKELLKARVEGLTSVWDKLNIIVQEQPLGLGHAVLQAKPFVQGAFGVILPDDLILEGQEATTLYEMMQSHAGGMSIAAVQVSDEDVSKYGNFELADKFDAHATRHRAVKIIEKPAIENAKSNLAAMGRYILPPEIMDVLERTGRGAGGEIQLTDAIETHLETGTSLWATTFKGTRFDCGDPKGYAHAQRVVAGRILGLR